MNGIKLFCESCKQTRTTNCNDTKNARFGLRIYSYYAQEFCFKKTLPNRGDKREQSAFRL